MPRAERPRGDCAVCGKNGAITDEGGMRHHFTENPEQQAGPDSRKCKGVGQPPAGAAAPAEEDVLGYACRGCNHPVELTANGRARSHLTPDGEPCPQGSSYPIRVMKDGTRTDTKPARSGEVRPGAGPDELRFGDDDPVADFLGTGSYRAGPQDPSDILGGSGAAAEIERIKTLPPEDRAAPADALLAQAVGNPGTVLDRLGYDPRDPEGPGVTTAEELRAAASEEEAAVHSGWGPEALAKDVFDPTHVYDDGSGGTWTHPGTAADCTMPECCTHPDGFVYGDDGNGHSGDVCMRCGGERPEPCTHPGEPVYGGTDEDGADVWTCEACGEREDPAVTRMRAAYRARCRVADLDEGVFFRRHTRPEPVGSLVYRAGAPTMGPLAATVVTAGPYAGRDGALTDMTEEVTCTDLDGRPRPALGATRAGTGESRRPAEAPPMSPRSSAASPPRPPTTTGTAPFSPRATTANAPSASKTSSKATTSGPTGTEATSMPTASTDPAAKAAADFLGSAAGSHGESEAEYGRWGRYKLRHPSTGKVAEWTRATTFAKSISDTFTLSQWNQRNVLIGATLRPDIVAAAAGKDVARDREQLNTWTEELGAAAGNKVAANLGTAVHSWTELVDRNWTDRHVVLRDQVPDEFKIHVLAYIELLEETGLEPVPTLIEFSTGVLQYEVMGTSDNCYRATRHLELSMPRGKVRLSPGEFVIGDKKTGKDLTYGWQEICIQLSLYAKGINSLGRFDWPTKTWDSDPLAAYGEPGTKVREDVGVILHLPVDPRSDKRPAVHGVDLEQGWNAAVLCERVRTWRKLRTLAGPVAVVDADPAELSSPAAKAPQPSAEAPRAAVRPPTLRERAEAVTSKPEASQVYQDAVAAKLPVAEVKELIAVMQEAIARVSEPGGAKV